MRMRITFSKQGWLIYSSHLDLMRLWERAIRRAGAPLAYSGGYNPRPKLQLARALPLGHAGEAELMDVWLEERLSQERFSKSLVPVLPPGLNVSRVQEVDPDAPAMQTQVVATEYRVIVDWKRSPHSLEARVEQLLAAQELPHQRRGKRYNLRPLIESLALVSVSDRKAVLDLRLSARPGATGRPEAVLDVLGMGEAFARYRRTGLILQDAG